MVTLALFRHAKSSWTSSARDDFDRPLAPRGRKAAPRMGKFIASEGLVPDVVLCSSAARAKETLQLALAEWTDHPPEVRYEDGLYHAGPDAMLDALRALPGEYGHAMLIGHNPGMHALALDLVGQAGGDSLNALAGKYPTAALIVLDFDGGWQDVAPARGTLRLFMKPKALPAES